MTRIRRAFVFACTAFALVTMACSSEPETPPASPTPFFGGTGESGGGLGSTGGVGSSGVTGSVDTAPTGATATGPTGPTIPLPTSSPATGTGNLTRGTLVTRVTGDLRVTKRLSQMISTVYQPGGGMALVWTAGGTDPSTVGLGGLAITGTAPTSSTLTLTIAVPSPNGGFESFISFDGECQVTIAIADPDLVQGSFRCSNLASGGVVVDANATFSASG